MEKIWRTRPDWKITASLLTLASASLDGTSVVWKGDWSSRREGDWTRGYHWNMQLSRSSKFRACFIPNLMTTVEPLRLTQQEQHFNGDVNSNKLSSSWRRNVLKVGAWHISTRMQDPSNCWCKPGRVEHYLDSGTGWNQMCCCLNEQ